jgi:hypothetical protein
MPRRNGIFAGGNAMKVRTNIVVGLAALVTLASVAAAGPEKRGR